MSRTRAVIALFALLLVALSGYYFYGRDAQQSTAIVERGSIDVTITTVGAVRLRETVPVRSKVAGVVEAVGVQPGDKVVAGDILVLLQGEQFDTTVTNAERALEAAEFDLQFAEERLRDDESSLDRQQEVITAQARVELANEALDEATENRARSAILAESDGVVLETFVAPGEPINQNQPVAQLLSPDNLLLVADIDELDLPNVGPGTAVRFRLDAYPATEVEGRIVQTAPQAILRGGATLFPAEVEFVTPAELDIRPGMNAEVTIITDLRENVLLIPESALRVVGQRAFVRVDNGAEFEEVEVLLGYRSGGVAEVVEGLAEGQRIELR